MIFRKITQKLNLKISFSETVCVDLSTIHVKLSTISYFTWKYDSVVKKTQNYKFNQTK